MGLTKGINVIKRDGNTEELDIEKIHKVLNWACEGIEGVWTSEIEAQAGLKFYNNMLTSDLHNSLIDASHELISEDSPNYDLVAGRLLMFSIRKVVYKQFKVPHILDVVTKNVTEGYYHPDILTLYSLKEWDQINSWVKNDRDFDFKISGAREWVSKYLIQNRSTGEFRESPQIAYMVMAAILMKKYVDDGFGFDIIKETYEELSDGGFSIPSPVAASIRSTKPQGASCTLLEVGDDLPSIGASASAILVYAAAKAGLGIGLYNLRAENQPIRNGEVKTTGPIPFGHLLQSAVSSCSQGGMRKGSATFYYNIWHRDVEKLLVLKNNKGTEETRIRHADHGFNINGYLLRKIFKGESIALFSPEEVPKLQKAFFDDQKEFERLYEKYSRSNKVKSRLVVSGEAIRTLMVGERSSTSRIYFHFVDNTNEQGSFIPEFAPVKQSNLCCEITLPTIPLKSLYDEEGLISLCTLCAINWGKIKKPSDFKRVCRIAVFFLDSLLDYQPYLLPAAKNSTDWYRSLGIGVNNLAYFLAKRGLKYNRDALEVVDEFMEAQAFYLTQASIELSKKYGPCGKYQNTKYSKGITPFDVRKKAVDELVPAVERLDWAQIKADLIEYGPRHATLMANMPSETSSRIKNMTNGGEPVRSLIVTKGGTKQVVQDYDKLKNKYDTEWEVELEGYIYVQAVMQKWMDQAISLNTRYDPSKFVNGMIPAWLIINHIGMCYKYGLKTMYYHNNRKMLVAKDDNGEVIEGEFTVTDEVSDTPVEILFLDMIESDEEDCESCTI
jgi:ribonucleoside-diphosphate reductase alpha chain